MSETVPRGGFVQLSWPLSIACLSDSDRKRHNDQQIQHALLNAAKLEQISVGAKMHAGVLNVQSNLVQYINMV